MQKRVLLARPNPFIRERLVPVLEKGDFLVIDVPLSQWQGGASYRPDGAIISLAAAADTPESAPEMAVILRRRWPDLPLLFSSLIPIERASAALEQVASQLQLSSHTMVTPDEDDSEVLGSRHPDTFLYFNHHHLSDAESRVVARSMLLKHFS